MDGIICLSGASPCVDVLLMDCDLGDFGASAVVWLASAWTAAEGCKAYDYPEVLAGTSHVPEGGDKWCPV